MADDVVAHAFSHGFHPQHVERLAAYWVEALGGPTTYSASFGDETTVKMLTRSGEHDEMDRRAIACFDQALADVGLANDGALRQRSARLLRLGDHDSVVPLPPVRR
jgi:hemoglobin